MNAPIKFSTQKGEGGTVGYSVMTLLLLYRLLHIRQLMKQNRDWKNRLETASTAGLLKKAKSVARPGNSGKQLKNQGANLPYVTVLPGMLVITRAKNP